MTGRATVVVVTWNGAHLLPACLDALGAQTLDHRVLVVDNASVDGTATLLADYPHVEVVRSPRNLGFAGGATLGLQRVATPYAVMLNNDAQPEPDWLARLLSGFDADDIAAVTSKVLLGPRFALVPVAGADRASVGTVTANGADVTTRVVAYASPTGCVLAVPAPNNTDVDVRVTGGTGAALASVTVRGTDPRVDLLNSTGGVRLPSGHGADRGYLEIDTGQYDGARDVFAVCGAAAAFRTDAGRAVGWFDPWFFAYYEDLDLSWRLRRAGWRVRYAPAARVRHDHAATSRVGSDVFLFHNRRNRLATLVRNASVRELVAALARRPVAPDGHGMLLGGPHEAEQPVRGKAAALGSFLGHLPRLLAGRVRESRRDVSPAATVR